MIPLWNTLAVGLAILSVATAGAFLYGRSLHTTVTEQQVIGGELLCPHREDIAISWQGPERAHADTVEWMQRCGWIETGTPLPR